MQDNSRDVHDLVESSRDNSRNKPQTKQRFSVMIVRDKDILQMCAKQKCS